jgi:hypothetical protein
MAYWATCTAHVLRDSMRGMLHLIGVIDWLQSLPEAIWAFLETRLDHWDAWVALGTLALAAATYYLARETRKLGQFTQREVAAAEEQARAAVQEVDIARRAFESSTQPVIVDMPADPSALVEDVVYTDATTSVGATAVDVLDSEDHLFVSVPLRNVGPGIAVVESARLRTEDNEWEGQPSVQFVAPWEHTRLRFSLRKQETGYAEFYDVIVRSGSITIEATYSDLAGHVQPVTRVSYLRSDDGTWTRDQVILLPPAGRSA